MKHVKLFLLLIQCCLLMMTTSARDVIREKSENLTTITTPIQSVSYQTVVPIVHQTVQFISQQNVARSPTKIFLGYAFNEIKAGSYIENLNVSTLFPDFIYTKRRIIIASVKYSMIADMRQSIYDMFTLNSDGTLYVNKNLDQKAWCTPTKCSEINIEIKEYSSSNKPRTIVLQRNYTNKGSPYFSLKEYRFRIPGNVQAGDEVESSLCGQDNLDEPPFNEVKISISPDSILKGYLMVKPEGNCSKISFKWNALPVDLIGRLEYSTTFMIEDNGPGKPLTSYASVNFLITSEVNLDVFCGQEGDGTVPETFDIQQPICTVTALDTRHLADKFKFSSTNFHMTEDGNIFANKSFDAEKKIEYEFNVTACVTGPSIGCATKQVRLNIEDINEHPPIFKTNNLTIEIEESTKIGAIIGKMEAIDEDRQNDTITYRLGNYNDQFVIEEKTGQIKLLESLNYEETTLYQLTVWATDDGIPKRHKTKVTVEIKVIDVNDNRPIFTHPSHNDQTFVATIGQQTPIVQLQAADSDSKQYGDIFYRLNRKQKSRAVFDLFELDQATGELTFKSDHPPLKDAKSFPLFVQVYDGGIPPLSDDMKLTIKIEGTSNVLYLVGVIIGSIVILIAFLCMLTYIMIKTNRCSKFYKTQEESEEGSEEGGEQGTDNSDEERKSYVAIRDNEESSKLTVVSVPPPVERSDSRNSKVHFQVSGSEYVEPTMTSMNGNQEQPGLVKDENGMYRYEPMFTDRSMTPSCSSVGYRNSPMNGNFSQGTSTTSTYMTQPMQQYQPYSGVTLPSPKPYQTYPYEDTARLLNSHVQGYDGLGDMSNVSNHPTHHYQQTLPPVIEGMMLDEQNCYYPGAHVPRPGEYQIKVTKSESAV